MKRNSTTLYLPIICACIIMSLAVSSCNFLNEAPYSELTNDNWGSGGKDQSTKITTAQQLEQLLTGTYNDYASEYWQIDVYVMNDGQSDNSYGGEDKEQTRQIDELRMSSSNGAAKRDWGYLYTQIAKANSILYWAPKVKDSALSDQRRQEIVGEACFIRAFAYFNLLQIYNHIPLITDYIPEINMDNIDDIYPLLYPAQSDTKVVYEQVIKDLDFARNAVADYSDKKFKVTKAAANLVLAEVYATKDGYAKADWNKVKEYAKAVTDNSHYGLMEHYDDLFAAPKDPVKGVLPNTDLTNENCKESLFEVDYKSWNTLGNWGAGMFYGLDWKKFDTPSQDLVKAFTDAKDTVRFKSSIRFENITGKWTDNYWKPNSYPFCWKMRAQEAGNIIILRLPEAILLLADAENELGNTGQAASLINQIRGRAKLEPTTASTKEQMRLAIENENRLEFAFEGKRWFDLKRRGRFIAVMQNCSDHQKQYGMNLNENKLYWPIPQSEIELNVNLKQNPGY